MQNDRVILIKGDNSKWYEQAIFIVRRNVPQNKLPVDLVAEAEKIVNSYIPRQRDLVPALNYTPKIPKSTSTTVSKKNNNNFDLFLNVIMLCSCLFLVGILLFSFFG